MSLKETLEKSFETYAGMTIMDRAICDARDCLKPSARMSMYAQFIEKITPDKPYKKSQKSVSAAMDHFYVHGDAPAYQTFARMGKPFAMRYMLEDFQGITGTIHEPHDEAASRYTEMRLAPISMNLFENIEKETISKWHENYSGEEYYPSVLPSVGFYNIVNGTSGIATAIASSIPQFNLREVNEAMIKLLWNRDTPFDEIYCAPDFCTGGIMLNAAEVKESLKVGSGFACKMRSVVEYDPKERCIIVKETPYGVYTDTIVKQLQDIVMSENNPGIEIGSNKILDQSTTTAHIKIFLDKKANPDKVIRYLYKNTSIQYHYPINMIMLDKGKTPKTFGWREALQAHIDHEIEVYTNAYNFDIKKIDARLHILDGLTIALANIDEVVALIKSAPSSQAAKTLLCQKFNLTEIQAKHILDMKLSRLAKLEVEKLKNEIESLLAEKATIQAILADENLLKAEVEKGLRAVASKYGDARRTKVIDLQKDSEEEPTEIRQLQISITSQNSVFVTETSTLYTQKRGGVGNKFKMNDGEYVIGSVTVASNEEILLFTKSGNVVHCAASSLPLNDKVHIQTLVNISNDEELCAITSANKKATEPYILFFTKNGLIKKSEIGEYNMSRKGALKAITLDAGDEIVNVIFTNTDNVGILTELGNFIIIETDDIRPIGRVARGVRAIKLNDGDNVISARAIPKDTTFIASISGTGLFKKTAISEFTTQGRGTKGAKIQKLNEADWMADFFPIVSQTELLVAATHACIKLTTNDVPTLSKGTLGNKSIKLGPADNVVRILIY
jgi:DNA gyrase subunit A